MRLNPVKERLAEGGHAFGTMVFEFFTPGIARIMAAAGAEFAMFDTEHGGVGKETVREQMAYARGTTCVPLVRVAATDPRLIGSALDAGALGVMAPMVESRAQAERLVSACRYPPHGARGAAFGIAHDDYEAGDVAAKMAVADARTLVIAMIETEAGVREVEAIAGVDGVDVLWLGHFDLTNSMGIPGQFTHPRFLDAVQRIQEAAGRHGQACGVMAGDAVWARDYLFRGFRMIAYGLDLQIFQSALAQGLTAVRGMVP